MADPQDRGQASSALEQLEVFGPIPGLRFDPQVPPPSQQDRGVAYAAGDIVTPVAEVFQDTRKINPVRDRPVLSMWHPVRPLILLDLTGLWPIANGCSAVLTSGRKDICQLWAEAIHTAWPELDGLFTRSAMTGDSSYVLFTHAADTFPTAPSFSLPLTEPNILRLVAGAATQINYELI